MAVTKTELRKSILEQRKALKNDERENFSKAVFDKIVQLPDFEGWKTMFIYVAYNFEVETKLLIKYALAIGKNVCVPCVKDDGIMNAVEIRSWDNLKKNKFGILEPIDETNEISKVAIDVAIVPGSVFDKKRNRIGYGKGYYDNFLKNTKMKKIGLAFDLQIVDQVPVISKDIPMDMVITPTATIE